jgi:hypothetical protein
MSGRHVFGVPDGDSHWEQALEAATWSIER